MRLEQWGAGKEHHRMASECPECVFVRVVLQERDIYQVVTEQEDYSARVSGKFRYEAESPSDYLTAKKRKFKEIAKLNKHNYKQ